MLSAFHISGEDWRSLDNLDILNEIIDVQKCGDIHPYSTGPRFPLAKIVFLRSCDKNFVFYWLNKRTFPMVQTIYLESHPCETCVLSRFPNATYYILERHRRYKERCGESASNVYIVTESNTPTTKEEMITRDILVDHVVAFTLLPKELSEIIVSGVAAQ
jgi:hypothetical protein